MIRLAIFTANDYTWAFPAWRRAIPQLQKQYQVVGLYVFPDQLGKFKGTRISLWYLRVFGFWSFFILGLYALQVRLRQWRSPVRTWKGLARLHGLEFHTAQTPNVEGVCQWVKAHNIDVILLTVGQVLKKEIIEAPQIGIINKHAAMLPSCRGLFPFFWAHAHNQPTGVTFHQVEEKIDAGKILVQKEYAKDQSMFRFYRQVFRDFPDLAVLAVERLVSRDYQEPQSGIFASYYGLPTREDVKKGNCSIAKWSDLCYEVRRD
ncbi:MAG: hypothetical protein HY602_00305 [Parcubacteria group bacterium]|nr:hypothetical protein [Parcubacteria group bacterium]